PALDRGATVIINKYLLSAYAHSRIRGIPRDFLERIYEFAYVPELTLYFDISPEIALARKLRSGTAIGFWEAGLDINLGLPLNEAISAYQTHAVTDRTLQDRFIEFQGRLRYFYQKEIEEYPGAIEIVDGALSMDEVIGV